LCVFSAIAYGCRIELVNDTNINIVLEDQKPGELFTIEPGQSQVVGSKHRRPTMIISMQVDKYPGAGYKKQFTVKQIACEVGAKEEPIQLRMTDIMQGTFDEKLFERTEMANVHKKLKASNPSHRHHG
jgi:hypothetical protein